MHAVVMMLCNTHVSIVLQRILEKNRAIEMLHFCMYTS
jgi:hypothetical protein